MFSAFQATKIKIYAKRLLALVMCTLSIFLVWDLCLKFLNGSTTMSMEQIDEDYLALPPLLLCSKQRYKKEALAAAGLPANFWEEDDGWSAAFHSEPFPDLNDTWLKATWPNEDLQAGWHKYEGMKG